MNIPQDKINNFALKYNLVNRELFEDYINKIKSKSENYNKEEINEFIQECKLNLTDAFVKNIDQISEGLNVDFNVMVKNPLIEGGQTLLRDAIIVIIVAPITKSIMKDYDEKVKIILDSM